MYKLIRYVLLFIELMVEVSFLYLEIKANHMKVDSHVTPVAVGGTLSALVVLIIVIAMLSIR